MPSDFQHGPIPVPIRVAFNILCCILAACVAVIAVAGTIRVVRELLPESLF